MKKIHKSNLRKRGTASSNRPIAAVGANNLKPFQPTHPGEVLKDELEYRGISQRGLAKEMGISYSALNEVLNCKRALNPKLAMMMEAALGVDAAPLLAMQNEYDMLMAERNESFM